MLLLRWQFLQQKHAAIQMQAWARRNIARAAYVIAAAEAKEQAKMENQLAALQRRLDEEAIARTKMEQENAALQERLQSVCSFRLVTIKLFTHLPSPLLCRFSGEVAN